MFLERKIQRALTTKAHQDLHAQIGLNELGKSVERFGADHPHTCLCPRLHGIDPDDAFSSVPYEKGYNFLVYLENLVGGPDVMEPFLKAHCQRYANKCVNHVEWKGFFLDYMSSVAKVDAAKLADIDWEAWYHKPGMPPVKNAFDQTLLRASEELAQRVANGEQLDGSELKGWDSAQVVIFLDKLIEMQREAINAGKRGEFGQKLQAMDEKLKLTESKNCELRFRWLTVSILETGEEEEVMQLAVFFLSRLIFLTFALAFRLCCFSFSCAFVST